MECSPYWMHRATVCTVCEVAKDDQVEDRYIRKGGAKQRIWCRDEAHSDVVKRREKISTKEQLQQQHYHHQQQQQQQQQQAASERPKIRVHGSTCEYRYTSSGLPGSDV
ncbi:hypothetical protein PV328_001846 [Microctonus aethiopoides]|uniref:Uncharacterized protein n=1 Tax=Microctonus aethiopoides TaxID=144406 RepID=A0AA39KY16_9HYME|nr:hypothetical protein PV328_001846 [Microctonus aethiopoides]